MTTMMGGGSDGSNRIEDSHQAQSEMRDEKWIIKLVKGWHAPDKTNSITKLYPCAATGGYQVGIFCREKRTGVANRQVQRGKPNTSRYVSINPP